MNKATRQKRNAERRELGITCEEDVAEIFCSYCKNKFLCSHIETEVRKWKNQHKQLPETTGTNIA